ncbi:DUF302 domain-containing protein [bacterium]|nr:DUF302 domain-containing protein [bacterium]NIN91411.1 DUF302 domain-containing protein [bacterium]NIO17821.1 DUF302 domain-containing protein [bacterium]NIO72802.1 DUF302 domain-containing protein [bacterium]
MNYAFTKELIIPFEKTIEIVTKELNKQKFAILTKIDVKEKFKEKLGIDFKRYVILGACNPSNAHKAILAEENIGLMLPCNVIVYEDGDNTTVSIIRPTVAMEMIKNEPLKKIAATVEYQLKKAFDSIT